jgi:hypothetical protein
MRHVTQWCEFDSVEFQHATRALPFRVIAIIIPNIGHLSVQTFVARAIGDKNLQLA